MTDHEQRLQDLGLSDWPHTVQTVCSNRKSFSTKDRARLAKRLKAYARRHGIDAEPRATLKDVCADLVQRVSSFAPEPLSETEQLWFLENIADQLKFDKESWEGVQREVQHRVEEHVVRDGWSWQKALVVVLGILAGSNEISGIAMRKARHLVPVCDEIVCERLPINSVVSQLQTGEITPQQLPWSLSDDLRDYIEERLPSSMSGPVTISEPWVQDLAQYMDVYYEAVRAHDAEELVQPQRTALQTMLTDLEAENDIEEGPISASALRRDVRKTLSENVVDNKKLVRLFGQYAAWLHNTREPSPKQIREAREKLGNINVILESRKFTIDDIPQNIPEEVIVIPSFAPVTIAELNRMAGLRTFLVGVTNNELEEFDQRMSDPLTFLVHDLNHMKEIYINLALAKPGVEFVIDVREDLDHYRSEYQKGNLDKIPTPEWDKLEAEQMRYREFIEKLKKTEDPNTVEEVENVFFFLWHEQGIPITSLARMSFLSRNKFKDFIVAAFNRKEFASDFFRVAKGSEAAIRLLFNHFRASPLAPQF